MHSRTRQATCLSQHYGLVKVEIWTSHRTWTCDREMHQRCLDTFISTVVGGGGMACRSHRYMSNVTVTCDGAKKSFLRSYQGINIKGRRKVCRENPKKSPHRMRKLLCVAARYSPYPKRSQRNSGRNNNSQQAGAWQGCGCGPPTMHTGCFIQHL